MQMAPNEETKQPIFIIHDTIKMCSISMLDIVCEHLFTDFSDQRDATLSSISADDICYIQISNKRNYFPFIENSTYCFNKGKRNWKITFFVELMIPS